MGLTEQAIKKNTLDKPFFDSQADKGLLEDVVGGEGFKNRKTEGPEIVSATARAMADENESQNLEQASMGTPFLKRDEKSELQDPQLAFGRDKSGYLGAGPDDVGSDD